MKDTIINTKIIGISDYGVFVEYKEYTGLIHISEISDKYIKNINDLFQLEQLIDVYVLEVNKNDRKLQLSYKKAQVIDKRMKKKVDVKIGFTSLSNSLEQWIKDKGDK